MRKFSRNDTVEVRVPCAYQGEVGRILKSVSSGVYYVQMPDGSQPSFCRYELKLSQQRIINP